MTQVWGGAAVGTWSGSLPQGFDLGLAPGGSVTVYYAIRAYDEGLPGCAPQVVQAPGSGLFKLVIEAQP